MTNKASTEEIRRRLDNALENDNGSTIDSRRASVLRAVSQLIGPSTVPVVLPRGGIGITAAAGPPPAATPTTKQIRDDLEFLEASGLIGRVVVNRRTVGYFLPEHCTRADALRWAQSPERTRDIVRERRADERRMLAELRAAN